MDRDTAKLYCMSFISWMKSGFKKNDLFKKQVQDLETAYNIIIESYEKEIAELKNETKV